MVKTKLVEELIKDGAKLLRELDQHNFPVEWMFWLHMPEEDYWRLVIGSPIVASRGGASAYRDLGALLRNIELSGVSLEDISLLNPESPQFRSFLSQVLSSNWIAAGEAWAESEDAVIYRAFVIGELSCDLSSEQLHRLWEAERKLSNQPTLLIDTNGRKIMLRFHPQHGTLVGIENVKQAFMIALHRPDAFPHCNVKWLN